jgi:regulator of ribonuclease activity A
MDFATADLYDAHADALQVLEIPLPSYGGRPRFAGEVATLKTYEDNTLVREILGRPGEGRVLVVDGAGSRRYALVGDRIGALAVENGWAGIVVHGCVRDAVALGGMSLGLRALGTCPRKTEKRKQGLEGVPLVFGGVRFEPGAWVYADEDGLVVAPRALA